jgi:ketosteroid isomerase-like protein
MSNRQQIVRDSYAAFAGGDRNFYEQHLSDDFLFSAPPDPKLDRDGYFERCWPGAGRGQRFDFVRMIESGDEVVVTYESDASAGGRGRNTNDGGIPLEHCALVDTGRACALEYNVVSGAERSSRRRQALPSTCGVRAESSLRPASTTTRIPRSVRLCSPSGSPVGPLPAP